MACTYCSGRVDQHEACIQAFVLKIALLSMQMLIITNSSDRHFQEKFMVFSS